MLKKQIAYVCTSYLWILYLHGMKNLFHIETPIGILAVETEDMYVSAIRIAEEIAAAIPPSGEFGMLVKDEIEGYFKGRVKEFSFSLAFMGTAFQLCVWEELMRIPYGTTVTYGEIAARMGRPRAARAVGAACNRNPILLAIPCHRVVGTDGKMTVFAVGIERKKSLIELERGTR